MIYVLLGMHKSGTTMLSQILHESGIPMGYFDAAVKYDEGNKFERRIPHDLNIEILGTAYEEHSLNVVRVAPDLKGLDPQLIQKLKEFLTDMTAKGGDWGFKDPRTCLTYAVWKQLLPEHKLAGIFRHPAELWEHYRRQKSRNLLKYFSICWKALRAWYVYNDEMLKILKSEPKGYFLAEYHAFMSEPEVFKKLCAFVGKPLHDSRNAKMYRSKNEPGSLYRLMLWVHKSFFRRDVMALYEELSRNAS